MNRRGMLIVLSGPSGSGKGTIIKSLLQQREDTVLSISVTTGLPARGRRTAFITFSAPGRISRS